MQSWLLQKRGVVTGMTLLESGVTGVVSHTGLVLYNLGQVTLPLYESSFPICKMGVALVHKPLCITHLSKACTDYK